MDFVYDGFSLRNKQRSPANNETHLQAMTIMLDPKIAKTLFCLMRPNFLKLKDTNQ